MRTTWHHFLPHRSLFPFSGLHKESLHSTVCICIPLPLNGFATIEFARQSEALLIPNNSGKAHGSPFKARHATVKPLHAQVSNSTVISGNHPYSLCTEGPNKIHASVVNTFSFIGLNAAYITCLIKNKILQPTICSLSWVHATYITDVSFKSTDYIFLGKHVAVCDCLPFVKVNLCSWFHFVEKSGPLHVICMEMCDTGSDIQTGDGPLEVHYVNRGCQRSEAARSSQGIGAF